MLKNIEHVPFPLFNPIILLLHMDEKEFQALIALLDDPDEKIYSVVKNKLTSAGETIIPLLETTWETSFSPIIQRRIENIIHNIQFEKLKSDIKTWKQKDKDNLLKFACLVSRYQYPDLDCSSLEHTFSILIREIWVELNNNLTALEKIHVINRIIYDYYGFEANKKNFLSPENFYLNKLLETKKGNATSLGILYLILCEGLNIPVRGVDLPEHFVLCYLDEEFFFPTQETEERNILFYINPFNKGFVFSKKGIEEFLKQLQIPPEPRYFLPMTPYEVALRLLKDLKNSYQHLGYKEKQEEIDVLIREIS